MSKQAIESKARGMVRTAFDFQIYAQKIADQVYIGDLTQEDADERMACFFETKSEDMARVIDGIVPAIRQLEADAAHLRAMAAEYIKKAVACENTAKRTKAAAAKAMEVLEVRALEGNVHKIKLQKGQKKVVVNEEVFKANKIDAVQYTSYVAKIDRKAIKDTLQGGGSVAGCELVQDDYPRIY